MSSTETAVRMIAALVTTAALAGCGSAGQGVRKAEKPQVNMQEAGERSEALLDETLKAIRPPVTWDYYIPNETACSDDLNLPTGTTTVKRGRFVVTTVSERRRGGFLGLVERHWKKQDYTITSVNPDKDMPAINARTPDGFVVSLTVGYGGKVFLDAASPCAADSALTFPKGTPGKPGGPKAPDLTLRHESAFWSAK